MRKIYKKKRSYKKKKKSILKNRWFFDGMLVFIFFACFSWLIFGTPYFKIEDTQIFLGEEKTSVEEIKNIIPKESNFFLFDIPTISNNIKKSFPKIKNVVVEKNFPNSVSIKIEEREAFATFCQNRENKNCFLISEDGIIFEKILKNDKMLLIIGGEKEKIEIGKVAIDQNLIKNIVLLKSKIDSCNIGLREIEIFQTEIKVLAKDGFFMYFSKDLNFKIQAEAVDSVFKDAISKEEKKKLKYVDFKGINSDNRGEIYWK